MNRINELLDLQALTINLAVPLCALPCRCEHCKGTLKVRMVAQLAVHWREVELPVLAISAQLMDAASRLLCCLADPSHFLAHFHLPCLSSCFQLNTFTSIKGVFYCKPHYEQLFQATGSLSKSFDDAIKLEKEKAPPPESETSCLATPEFTVLLASHSFLASFSVNLKALCYHHPLPWQASQGPLLLPSALLRR